MKQTLILLALLVGGAAVAFGQQSAKSKSKERNREKDSPGQVVRVLNAKYLNSPNTDYSPAFYQNGIVYVSSRKKSGPVDAKSQETYSQLYFAPFDPNGDPANPQSFSLEINSSLHEGPVTFSRDYKTMFFTRNNMHKGVQKAAGDGKVRLKIYEAQKGPIDWGEVRELPFNADTFSCVHPSLSPDGKRLYFSSDMPGGVGGFDLYVSERGANGGWKKPMNLGPRVNSVGNDVFPFIHGSGTLFFSSNGYESSKGLDMYFVDVEENGDTVVVSLGEPFNSKEDDLGIILNDDGTRGFFASDRKNGLGKDDIFSFTIEKGIEGVGRPEAVAVNILVTDAQTGKPIQGAEIRILQPSEDGFVSNQEAFYNTDLLPDPLKPNVLTLELVPKNAQDMGRPDLYTNAVGEARHEFMRYRSYLLLVNMNGYQTAQKLFTLEENSNPGVIAVKLADAPVCHRANGVVATVQFGTRIANATLTFMHKSSGRKETFRTNLNGEYDVCLPLAGEYVLQVDRPGFKPETVTLEAAAAGAQFNDIRLRPTELVAGNEEKEAQPLKPGSVVVMDNIRYEANKTTLNESAVRHLNAVYELLTRYPDMSIELIVHTDTRGDAGKNMQLSKERAENAKTYLEYRGIAGNRIKATGKGETQPRNHCTEGVACSEEEHAVNSRMEVVVLK